MPCQRSPRRSRRCGSRLARGAAAAAAASLLAGCLGPPSDADTSSASGRAEQRIASLRAAAALPACPSGISPEVPELTLPCLSGGADVALNDAGPDIPMLVNIWATWCAPCVREVPLLVDLAEQAAGELVVVGVLTQDTPVNALEFAREFTMNYTSVLDDDGLVMRRFSAGPPVTLFVSAQGQVRHVKRGAFKNAAELQQLVREQFGLTLAEQP